MRSVAWVKVKRRLTCVACDEDDRHHHHQSGRDGCSAWLPVSHVMKTSAITIIRVDVTDAAPGCRWRRGHCSTSLPLSGRRQIIAPAGSDVMAAMWLVDSWEHEPLATGRHLLSATHAVSLLTAAADAATISSTLALIIVNKNGRRCVLVYRGPWV